VAYVRRFDVEGEAMVEYNNLTIINLLLKAAGPLRERDLTLALLLLQAGLQITRVFFKKTSPVGFFFFFDFYVFFLFLVFFIIFAQKRDLGFFLVSRIL
jgi:hypothetical protein